MFTPRRTLVLLSATVLLLSTMSGASADLAPPPAYVTLPHLAALDADPSGQLTFGPTGIVPASQVPGAPAGAGSQSNTSPGILAVSGTTNTTNAPDSYQGETMLAAGARRLVGGQNDLYPGACNAAAPRGAFGDCAPSASASSDGGLTWTRTKLFRDWGSTNYFFGFDPSVAFDGRYFLYAYGVADGNLDANAIVVAASIDGINWIKRTPVVQHPPGSGIFEDKYWIAVDHSAGPFNRSAYVAWDRNIGNDQILFISFSRPDPSGLAGSIWSAPIKVNDGTSTAERVIGAYPAVDQRNGTVYVSWHDYARGRIFVDKSTDGGQTWGTDVAAATTHTGFGTDIGCNGGRLMGPAHHLLVGPNGTLYIVYADSVTGSGYDILVVRSTDGGATWSAPARANDDATGTGLHQYNPGASIDAVTGELTVSFYDRRDDPTGNCRTHVYATRTSDGITFTPNELVTGDGRGPFTTGQSNYNGNPNGPGDYAGSASVSFSPVNQKPGAHPYYVRHVDPDTFSGGGFEVYSSIVTH